MRRPGGARGVGEADVRALHAAGASVVIAAIRAGDPPAAHETARTHRLNAVKELLPAIEELGLKRL